VNEMKSRYLIGLLAIVMLGTMPGIGSDYQLIGKGGPNRLESMSNNNSISESLYEIFPGLPYSEDFFIPEEGSDDYGDKENRSSILNYTYNETLKGHVFTFQGHLIVGDFEKFLVDINMPGKIIVKSMNDLICRHGNQPGGGCYVYSGYLVDNDGNLRRLKELRIIPGYESGLVYEGTGYLIRVQRVTIKLSGNTIFVPDPGEYNVTWSKVERRQ